MSKPLLPYQQRVIDEKAELDRKRDALDKFTHSSTYNTLSWYEQNLLHIQATVMDTYSSVLSWRIHHFNHPIKDSKA